MEYSIRQLSELSGVSARTLRYYDQINLLKPRRISEAGYRYYGEYEVDTLQQILFYKNRGFHLSTIAEILYNKDFNRLSAMEEHLKELEYQQRNTADMIDTVKQTIAAIKGECLMADYEKFQVFKKNMITKNEEMYGKEIREAYGDEDINKSNQKMLHMTEEEYQQFRTLEEEIINKLEQAVKKGEDPQKEEGKQLAKLHKQWISMVWSSYSAQAHKGVAKMYTMDERFKKYYDRKENGCAEFLQKAIEYWA